MANNPLLSMLWRVVRDVAYSMLKQSGNKQTKSTAKSTRATSTAQKPRAATNTPAATSDYPGDYSGSLDITYDPHADGQPDPGEIVWTWVPYEEDYSQGKDRPVLLIGRDGDWLLALQVTSKDHDRDAAQEARSGRHWIDIGSGEWDVQRRPSEVRVNRIIRVNPAAVRRIGAVLDRERFNLVAAEVRRFN